MPRTRKVDHAEDATYKTMNLVVASRVISYGTCEEKVLEFMDKTPAHLTSVIINRKGADEPSFVELVLHVCGGDRLAPTPKSWDDADVENNTRKIEDAAETLSRSKRVYRLAQQTYLR